MLFIINQTNKKIKLGTSVNNETGYEHMNIIVDGKEHIVAASSLDNESRIKDFIPAPNGEMDINKRIKAVSLYKAGTSIVFDINDSHTIAFDKKGDHSKISRKDALVFILPTDVNIAITDYIEATTEDRDGDDYVIKFITVSGDNWTSKNMPGLKEPIELCDKNGKTIAAYKLGKYKHTTKNGSTVLLNTVTSVKKEEPTNTKTEEKSESEPASKTDINDLINKYNKEVEYNKKSTNFKNGKKKNKRK